MIISEQEFESLKKVVINHYDKALEDLGPEIGWSHQDWRKLGQHEGKLELLSWFHDYFNQKIHVTIFGDEITSVKREPDNDNK